MVKQMNFFDLKEGYIGLSNTEVTFLDSIFDPFGTATDEQSFLNVEETLIADVTPSDNVTEKTFYEFYLHGKTTIQQRIRFGFW